MNLPEELVVIGILEIHFWRDRDSAYILEPISDLHLGFPRLTLLQDPSGMVTGITWVG